MKYYPSIKPTILTNMENIELKRLILDIIDDTLKVSNYDGETFKKEIIRITNMYSVKIKKMVQRGVI
jgi:hypothetical protein